ncbi:DUF6650 family protein [Streptomyces sp. NPDC051219]|uniref:DUF6650 family protein n=1 Tax=Streptomyces sp. NPDC051219 TaxID=3155283 RepID=UPI00344975AF
MRASEIMRRIKGFSTPLGGLDWEAPVPQRVVAKRVLVYLEDRRVLTTERGFAESLRDPEHCVASVLQIREMLTQILMEPDTSEELADHLKVMRAACRRYLNRVGTNDSVGRQPTRLRSASYGAALGELRAVFGIQLGVIATRYKLELSGGLEALLPAADSDDDDADARF